MKLRYGRLPMIIGGVVFGLMCHGAEPIAPWTRDALMYYESAERLGENARPPETVEAERVFEQAKQGELDIPRLERLAYWERKGCEGICEAAQAVLILSTIRANDPARFEMMVEKFRATFPESRFAATFASPGALMKVCPACKGKSKRQVNCSACQNTGNCLACDGKGRRIVTGLERSRRMGGSQRVASSGRSSRRSTGKPLLTSHRTNLNGGTLVVQRDDQEVRCMRCKGTGRCPTCANAAQKRLNCAPCKNLGAIPDPEKLLPVLTKVAEEGMAAARSALPETRVAWDQTQAVQEVLRAVRQEDDLATVRNTLQEVLTRNPQCAQRKELERLEILLSETERKVEAEWRVVEADTQKLGVALAEALNEKGNYRRYERLIQLKTRFPKASNRGELEAALEVCEANIEREEAAVRNALKLLENVESPQRGIQQIDKIIGEMDPISPLMSTAQSMRADFVERLHKAQRNRQILWSVLGLGGLLLIYFLFDLLNGIWQTRRSRRW